VWSLPGKNYLFELKGRKDSSNVKTQTIKPEKKYYYKKENEKPKPRLHQIIHDSSN